jgi:hypothetical protein
MSFVFIRSAKKILGMQRQARRAVFKAVRLFDTDKKATKLNRARIFTETQVCFSYAINLFISWELIPIDYGKIRVLNMTKSAKTRRKSGRNRARKSASFGHLKAQSRSILFGRKPTHPHQNLKDLKR